jgi:hypothetical protein
MMKLIGIVAVALFGVASSEEVSSTGRVDFHLNSILETMPASVDLVQMQATMLSSSTIDVRDEIAALLYKMSKDISKQESEEKANNIKVQNSCDKRHRRYTSAIKEAQAAQKEADEKERRYHAEQKAIPAKVLKKEAKIRQLKVDIMTAEVDLATQQKQRDTDRELYLQGIADFNKALDDIDLLRTLVETGLSNRGKGANSNSVRYTQSPTKKGYTFPPTKPGYDRKVTHKKVNPGKLLEVYEEVPEARFLEITSADQIASMSRQEAVEAMKGVYANLKSSASTNGMVLAVVETLDSVMSEIETQDSSSVDKIRSLLLQVRNELQKSKREATNAENRAINSWKSKKTQLRNGINDIKINWNGIYKQKAALWKLYGDKFQSEGQEMRLKAIAKAKEDSATINDQFEAVVCKDQDADYKMNSQKRHGQLVQIKKALGLLSKFGLAGKYGKMVRESIKDVNAGLCRAFDDSSKWVSVSSKDYHFKNNGKPQLSPKISGALPEAAANIYNNSDSHGKFICMSGMQYTVTCGAECDIRTTDKRFPVTGKYSRQNYPRIVHIKNNYGKSRTTTIRFPKALKYRASKTMALIKKGKTSRTDVSVYVIPGCNCMPHGKDLTVTDNQAKTVVKKGAKTVVKKGAKTVVKKGAKTVVKKGLEEVDSF